jgi:SNF2 family DNA or RNA helicase
MRWDLVRIRKVSKSFQRFYLGKTVQVIALVCSLVQDGAPGPFLVVAPLSTLTNWCTEFARFAPSVSIRSFLNVNNSTVSKWISVTQEKGEN